MVQTQTQGNEKFDSCLVVSRHELLTAQREDVQKICGYIDTIAELPLDQQKLKETIKPYSAIIGTFPVNLQIDILNNKKTLLVFVMKSLGVTDNEKDAENMASRYPGRSAILFPSKINEKFRVTLYEGIKIVKEIKVIDDWLIKHES